MGSIIFNVANENVANPTQQLLAEPAIVDMHADGETTVSSECSHVCQRFDTAGHGRINLKAQNCIRPTVTREQMRTADHSPAQGCFCAPCVGPATELMKDEDSFISSIREKALPTQTQVRGGDRATKPSSSMSVIMEPPVSMLLLPTSQPHNPAKVMATKRRLVSGES
jgi:hypothetical protein